MSADQLTEWRRIQAWLLAQRAQRRAKRAYAQQITLTEAQS